MEENQRRYKRFNLDFIKVNGRMKFTSSVDIIDISLGGISLKTDRRLNIGSEYTLNVDEKGRLLSATGVVVWSSLLESKKSSNGDFIPIYATGMEFKDAPKEKISELVSFVESYAEGKTEDSSKVQPRNGLRLHMRFHVTPKGNTSLTCPENYKVKEISMGGMLIETDNALKVGEKLPMEISLPGNYNIRFLGRITSSTHSPEAYPEKFAIGIEFLDMPNEYNRQLNVFISMLPHQNISSPLP